METGMSRRCSRTVPGDRGRGGRAPQSGLRSHAGHSGSRSRRSLCRRCGSGCSCLLRCVFRAQAALERFSEMHDVRPCTCTYFDQPRRTGDRPRKRDRDVLGGLARLAHRHQ